MDQIRMPISLRNLKLPLKHQPNSKQFKRNTLYASIQVYNEIPQEIQNLKIKEFKQEIFFQKFIKIEGSNKIIIHHLLLEEL